MQAHDFPIGWLNDQLEHAQGDAGVRLYADVGHSRLRAGLLKQSELNYVMCLALQLGPEVRENIERRVQHRFRVHWIDVLGSGGETWHVVAVRVHSSEHEMLQTLCREFLDLRWLLVRPVD